jgi:hypothetical protein
MIMFEIKKYLIYRILPGYLYHVDTGVGRLCLFRVMPGRFVKVLVGKCAVVDENGRTILEGLIGRFDGLDTRKKLQEAARYWNRNLKCLPLVVVELIGADIRFKLDITYLKLIGRGL